MRAVALLVLCLAVLGSPAEARGRGCNRGYILIAGNCYKFHQRARTWDDAMQQCEKEGAQLASVHTYAEYSGLLTHINKHYAGTYWTSGATVRGKWVWTATGQSMRAQWWGRSPSKANNQCAYFCSYTLKYWNKSCSNRVRFICQKPQ